MRMSMSAPRLLIMVCSAGGRLHIFSNIKITAQPHTTGNTFNEDRLSLLKIDQIFLQKLLLIY